MKIKNENDKMIISAQAKDNEDMKRIAGNVIFGVFQGMLVKHARICLTEYNEKHEMENYMEASMAVLMEAAKMANIFLKHINSNADYEKREIENMVNFYCEHINNHKFLK